MTQALNILMYFENHSQMFISALDTNRVLSLESRARLCRKLKKLSEDAVAVPLVLAFTVFMLAGLMIAIKVGERMGELFAWFALLAVWIGAPYTLTFIFLLVREVVIRVNERRILRMVGYSSRQIRAMPLNERIIIIAES